MGTTAPRTGTSRTLNPNMAIKEDAQRNGYSGWNPKDEERVLLGKVVERKPKACIRPKEALGGILTTTPATHTEGQRQVQFLAVVPGPPRLSSGRLISNLVHLVVVPATPCAWSTGTHTWSCVSPFLPTKKNLGRAQLILASSAPIHTGLAYGGY